MSNSITVLQEFKKALITFFDELIEQFPEEGDLIFVRIMLKDRLPINEIMNYFIKAVLPEKPYIKARDQKFFTDSNALFGMLGSDRSVNLKKIWKSPKLDKEDREVIWKWMDSFIFLTEKYQKSLESNVSTN
jgi:hypothetical protein